MPRSCRFDLMTMVPLGFDAIGSGNKAALWPEHGPCLLCGTVGPPNGPGTRSRFRFSRFALATRLQRAADVPERLKTAVRYHEEPYGKQSAETKETCNPWDRERVRGSPAYRCCRALGQAARGPCVNQVLDAQIPAGGCRQGAWGNEPKVSALRHCKLAGFSGERLMNLLTVLDHDVEIAIAESPVAEGWPD
jgi:hypothetical protein